MGRARPTSIAPPAIGTRFAVLAMSLLVASPVSAQATLPTIYVHQKRDAIRRPTATEKQIEGPGAARPAPVATATAAQVAPPIVSRWAPTLPDGTPAFVERWRLPNTLASTTRETIQREINILSSDDSVRYMPSLYVRKRNNGDSQAPLQTRTWGLESSARSLVYADDLLLTPLIANDSVIGAPRWGLVAPEEIERVDFLYGPYAAQYPGNAMGGVLKITTRMPEKLEVSLKDTVAVQDFSQWGTNRGLVNNVTNLFIGDKNGDLSWTVSGSWQRGSQQPMYYVTLPVGGAQNLYPYPNSTFATTKFGVPATVVGATSPTNDQVNGKLKLAYDFTNTIRGTYTLGYWSNDSTSYSENYLARGYGATFGAGFSRTNPLGLQNATLQNFGLAFNRVQGKMLTNAAALKSNTGGVFDWEISASNVSTLQYDQLNPYSGAVPYGGWTLTGRNTSYSGTYWTLLDIKGILRPEATLSGHDISFGLHGDQYHLNNPTWVTTNWAMGTASAYGVVAAIGNGTTRTQALWAQDDWRINERFKLTAGLRGENWIGSNGYNQQLSNFDAAGIPAIRQPGSSLPVYQPATHHARWSPKASLQWTPDDLWTVTGLVGLANRFATTKELYNIAVVGGVATNSNPNLLPEVALTKELSFERNIGRGGVARVSLFDEDVRDAIITQTFYAPRTSTLASAPSNVEHLRNSGVEMAINRNDVYLKGLELTGSVTFVNSRILSNPDWVPSGGANLDNWCASVAGKNVPYVPKWRWTGVATYRPDAHWSFTLAARWQDRMWSSLANNDIAHGVFGSYDRFFVVDTKINYNLDNRWTFDFGVDNIGNYKYFLFNPLPQRTFFFSARYNYGAGKSERGPFFAGNEDGGPDIGSWLQPVGVN